MATKKMMPIAPELFTLPEGSDKEPHLIGSRCKACGELYFPTQITCSRCFSENLEIVYFSSKGKVRSSTVIYVRPPLYEGPMPYAIGQVTLAEGVIVPVVFTDLNLEKPLPIDTEVEMVLKNYGTDNDGHEIITYMFRPIKRETAGKASGGN